MVIQLLRDEGGKGNGYNRTGKWNDYCGCYHQHEENGVMVMTDELEFGCGDGGSVVKCTFCYNVAHLKCCGYGDNRKNAPKGDWACPSCMDHAEFVLKPNNNH